jgi:2-hydroxychromene-2-carboxylate isomerase
VEKLQTNQRCLQQQGHYLSAMIKYAGEWYWGLDRLDHLERRLNDLGASKAPLQVYYNRQTRNFCGPVTKNKSSKSKTPAKKTSLTMYFSARSPYSYLGLEQAAKLCKHYQIPLQVKPVLPMVMRGMNVPHIKKMYIFHDTKREANKLGIIPIHLDNYPLSDR